MKAKKSLGQNFLINDTIIENIVSLFYVTENDLIIEIGPGRGALTEKLSKLPSRLLCIEVDKDLKPVLSKFESENCKIIYEDILKVDLKTIVQNYQYDNLYIVGNLPYYITSPILEHLIKSGLNINQMVFMVQKEVADRFSAKSCSSNYGYMTLFLNYYYNVTSEIFVPKKDFNPIPKVDSMVIKLEPRYHEFYINEQKYFSFLKNAFRLKRKTLKNNLSSQYNWQTIKEVLEANKLNENVRAEQITQELFIEIYLKLFENQN
ncbi:MAG: ribosomal RNA small subunit methyltransferase A [Firmicutes bacterium]|nr:ribosomal RNA small subunit methyltransferase A [Bacillota bacterium]